MASKYDHIIIDVGGRDSGSLRAALTVAHLVLIPVQPRSFDLWGVDQTTELITEARELNESLRAVAVLNAADPRGNDNESAAALLRDNDALELAPAIIIRRKAFPNAAAEGLSVIEYGDSKAHAEFEGLALSLDKLYTNNIGGIAHGNR